MRRHLPVAAGLLALACSDPEPAQTQLDPAPTEMPTVDLAAGGAPVIRLLDRLGKAELKLADDSAESRPAVREVRIAGGCQGLRRKPRTVWHCPLPTTLAQLRFSQKPDDTDLLQGETALPYVYGLAKGRPALSSPIAWGLARGRLVIASRQPPGSYDPPLVFRQSNADQAEQRFSRSQSGLSPAEFTRLGITKGTQTRDAMLLPAPSEATFRVEVPPGAKLRFGWGVAPTTEKGSRGQARLSVQVDGVEQWTANASSAEEWQDGSVDLSAFEDQTVDLTLRTDVVGTPTRAYAAFTTPEIVGAPTETGPRRVVVIGLDTLRPDHLQTHGYHRATSPGMKAIAEQSIVFTEARAPAPRTRPSFRTSTTGRWPLAAITAPTLGETLRAHGFSTAGFVANVQLAARLGFADGYDLWSYDNMADADVQVDRVLGWLGTHATEDAAIFLHLMDPHIFYLAPEPYRDRFTDGFEQGDLPDKFNRWNITRWYNKGQLSESQQGFMIGRYDGEIAFMDQELVRLVQAIDQLPGQTLFVFHSDHGEEFFEHGGFEHNHTLYEELVRTVLWVRPPGGWGGGPHTVEAPTSLVDIVPTVLDLVGIPATDRPPTDGISLSPFIDAARSTDAASIAAALDERPLPLGHLMLDKERWGVVIEGHKYILHTMSGLQELYDLAADPGETSNLATVQPERLAVFHQALSRATGWPLASGWRLHFTHLPNQLTLHFDQPVASAGIIDPEAGRKKRANLEWGERPPVRPDDVAHVTVAADGLSIEVTPGTDPAGTMYILGPGAGDIARAKCDKGTGRIKLGETRMCTVNVNVDFGPILLPTDSEANRLRAAPGADVVEALQTLGYVE